MGRSLKEPARPCPCLICILRNVSDSVIISTRPEIHKMHMNVSNTTKHVDYSLNFITEINQKYCSLKYYLPRLGPVA